MAIDQTDIHHYRTKYYEIDFQEGPAQKVGQDGCQNEDIIEVLLHRLRGLQDRLSCRENALAITKLEEALMWLEKRTSRRVAQGVEGTEKRHRRE